MNHLRRVKAITRRDKIRHSIVIEELEVQPIDELKWFGHNVE